MHSRLSWKRKLFNGIFISKW